MATTIRAEQRGGTSAVGRRLTAGVAGGLAGGVVFGMMMAIMGMIPMVAKLVGSDTVVVGWLVHLAISAVIGAGFGLAPARLTAGWVPGLVAGAGYGMVWWVLGALLLMPARLGMPTFRIDAMAWKSLMGHIIYGMVLAAVVVAMTRRSTAAVQG